mgnify:CR=1 FL=1
MSILVESCNKYLYEGVVNSMPLCEADESEDKKSLWQKIKDFFKNIWNWIKDKVLALFGKKKKSDEEKLKELKELLKDSKEHSDPAFIDFYTHAKDTLFTSDSMDEVIELCKKDDDTSRAVLEKTIEELEKVSEDELKNALNFTLNNLSDVEKYEEVIKKLTSEISNVNDKVAKLIKDMDNKIPDSNMMYVRKIGDLTIKAANTMVRLMSTNVIDNSIAAIKGTNKNTVGGEPDYARTARETAERMQRQAHEEAVRMQQDMVRQQQDMVNQQIFQQQQMMNM